MILGVHYRSGRKIGASEPNRKKLLEKFEEKLSTKQKELLGKATNPFFGIDSSELFKHIKVFDPSTEKKCSAEEIKQQDIEDKKEQKIKLIEFEKSLSKSKKEYFKKEINPFLDNYGRINDPLENFDLKIAQRWIFNRVVNLGYNPDIHNQFDKNINSYISDRREHKAERIGKKYQWIAYHEFLALVSDHFEFKGDSWGNSKDEYKGAWQSSVRDIDTSFILQNDEHINNSVAFSQWKTSYGNYDAWEKKKSDVSWIKTNKDLPNPNNIIQIFDDNKKEWVMLKGFIKWEEKTPPEHKKYDIPVREVWYMINSYIVKKNDAKKFFKWAKEKDFSGRWMPESNSFYKTFLGEYPNYSAFEDSRGDYNTWTKSGTGSKELQIPVVVTDDSYLNEFTLDCSHNGSVSVKLPCKWLANKMKLHHKYLDGRFYDKKNNLITIATSVFEESFPSVLLIDKKALIEFLDKNGYAIFWTLLGEKQLFGGSHSRDDFVGILKISGAYTINKKGEIIGENHNKFNK